MAVKRFNPLFLVALIVMVLLGACAPAESEAAPPPSVPSALEFTIPKKSPHWESNTPEHTAVLAAVPVNVVINFNFDLGPGSSISITNGGKEFAEGATVIDGNKLSMRREMSAEAPDGIYLVSYRACWPDGSCHDGSFEFALDRSKAGEYGDLRGRSEVNLAIEGFAFIPGRVRITRGTKIIWTNKDGDSHYVNTDSHPAHTYYPEMNSQALSGGESFSVILSEPGIYTYHCSAHSYMKGEIIVE